MSSTPPETGINAADRANTADHLAQLLADSYTLYLKTQDYHWNVTGQQFGALHALFEAQYTDLALAVDAIAKRIRALGHRTPLEANCSRTWVVGGQQRCALAGVAAEAFTGV